MFGGLVWTWVLMGPWHPDVDQSLALSQRNGEGVKAT